MSAPASVPRVARPSEATAFARPAYFTDIIFFMLSAIHTVANSALVKILPPQQSVLLVPSAGCPFGSRCSVSFWGQMKGVLFCAYAGCPFGGRCSSALSEADEGCPSGGICCGTSRGSMRVVLSGADAGSPSGDRCMMSLRGADTIELHEIHLARQSSLQVPVGHIPVPGGIKLCSPGTFWVANYLIINNSSCQVNFTKHAVGW